jgi:hypothetical protein
LSCRTSQSVPWNMTSSSRMVVACGLKLASLALYLLMKNGMVFFNSSIMDDSCGARNADSCRRNVWSAVREIESSPYMKVTDLANKISCTIHLLDQYRDLHIFRAICNNSLYSSPQNFRVSALNLTRVIFSTEGDRTRGPFYELKR